MLTAITVLQIEKNCVASCLNWFQLPPKKEKKSKIVNYYRSKTKIIHPLIYIRKSAGFKTTVEFNAKFPLDIFDTTKYIIFNDTAL